MSVRYVQVIKNQEPFPYGLDQSGRTLFSCNFSVTAAVTGEFVEEDAAWLVESEGLGVRGVDLFIGPNAKIPGGAGPFTLLLKGGGTSPLETHNEDNYPRPALQVIVRGGDYQATRERIESIANLLGYIRNTTVDNTIGFALLEGGGGFALLEGGGGVAELEEG